MKIKNIGMSLALSLLLLVGCTGETGNESAIGINTSTKSSTAIIINHNVSVSPISKIYYRKFNTKIWKEYSSNFDLEADYYTSIVISDCDKEYDFKAVYANSKEIVRTKYNMECGEEVDVWFWLYRSSIPDENVDCSVEGQNKMIYDIMHDAYLWYQYTPELDYSSYLDKDKLLDDLIYKDYDIWSYITTTEENTAYFEEGTYGGTYGALGYSLSYFNDKVYIRYVYQDSPAGRAGLTRGVEILAINGKTIKEIEDEYLWFTIDGKNEVGAEVNLQIKRNSKIEDITLVKDEVTINTVLDYRVLSIDSQKIGYLMFDSFIEPSREELKKVFEEFQKESIDKLILDLRYNGGGRLDVARYLASLIGGDTTKEKIFETITYNDIYTDWNSEYIFSDENITLGLDSVYIITTENTASASESVINGLKPFLNIHLIGSSTHGKPVGMNGYDFCDTHVSPIMFIGMNADGEGDYFDGFTPICRVDDNITKDFGDINESMLKETLFYIKNSECSTIQEKRLKKVEEYKPYKQIYRGFQREIGAS